MDIIAKIAERKIYDAMERGEFDNLPGKGKPFMLDDDSSIPEELRSGYRILKNAGYLPPELEIRKEIVSLRELIGNIDDEEERRKRLREMNFKIMKYEMMIGRPLNIDPFPEYEDKIYERLS